jgi:hypothetical protein
MTEPNVEGRARQIEGHAFDTVGAKVIIESIAEKTWL